MTEIIDEVATTLNKLPSRFQIGDTVSYHEPFVNPPRLLQGTIVEVSFTKSKVRYDILDEDAHILRGVSSNDVFPIN